MMHSGPAVKLDITIIRRDLDAKIITVIVGETRSKHAISIERGSLDIPMACAMPCSSDSSRALININTPASLQTEWLLCSTDMAQDVWGTHC